MSIASIWKPLLQCPTVPKIQILSISPDGLDPDVYGPGHLATEPGVIRCATHRGVVIRDASGQVWPFWPWISDWIPVERDMVVEDRRAEIPDAPAAILGSAGLARILTERGSGLTATYRLDLWAPGVPLEQVINLQAGRLRDPAWDALDGTFSCTLSDGAPEVSASYPAPITQDQFPDAPFQTQQTLSLQTIIGKQPDNTGTAAIDTVDLGTTPKTYGSRTFLVHASTWMTDPPTAVFDNGVPLSSDKWQIINSVTQDLTATRYTAIVLTTAVDATHTITCSGGTGITDTDPMTFLLAQANLKLTPEAQQLLIGVEPLDFQLILNNTGAIVGGNGILDTQVLPQTEFCGTYLHGRYHLYELLAETPSMPLGIGSGLRFALSTQPAKTDPTRVYNVLTLRCGRDLLAGTPLFTIYRDATHGSPAIQAMLTESQRRYGRRPFPDQGDAIDNSDQLTSGYPALDVAVQYDADSNPIGSLAGEVLADLLVTVHAFQRDQRAYQMTWWHGMTAQLNWGVPLTEPRYELADAPSRITQWILSATGPQSTHRLEGQAV